ncbi:PAS domain S-box protein [Methanoregula sp.]|uniref:PAS domain S-box protein n=1 Tax=Methanoregula sp. TaxID=2052170 RepID=UPI003567F6F3
MYRILYVDDEPALLEIGKLFLEEKGQFSVDTSLSASAGLDLLASAHYDAVISDYQMPGMDGIGFLKKVRTSGNTIPFILFTGRGREEVVIQALNEGADFYLQKGGEPVSQFAELAHKIRQSVQKRQAELMIRDHERREAEIINFLPDATFAIDIHGKVIAWNRAIEEMTGVPVGEIIGKADYEYALPFYHERRPVTVDLVLHDDPSVIEKYPVMKKDGSSLFSEIYIPHFNKSRGAHLWFTASPLYDTAGNLTGAIESIRDITERVRAKEALNLEKQRIESLLSLNRMETRTDAEISAQVIEDAIRLTGSTIGYLTTVNDDESVITMQNWSTSAHESCKIINKPIVYSVEKTGLWGEAVRQRKPVITKDYAAKNPLKHGMPNGHVPLVRHMNIPVFEGDHIVAVAGVGNKDTNYNEGDVHELQLLMQGWWQIRVRKRAQEEIRRSNMILKTQQEISPDGILTVDEQRKILNYNQTFVAIWKIPLDLLATGTNEPVLRHMAGQVADPDTFLTRVQDVYDQKVAKSFEDLLLKDGRVLEWFSAPMLGEEEEYFGRVWFFRDITRRKMDEDAIRAAQEKFSTIYLQSPDVIWISELESGRFIDVNNAAERIFGYTREEFIGRNSLNLGIWVNPEDRTVLTQRIQKEGRVDRFGIILRRKNGENFHAECSASTIHIRGTEYLIITIRDISGMKRAQEALKESEEKFRLIVENSHDIIYTLTAKGVFIFVSPAWTNLLGHPVTQVTGHPFMEFVHPDDIPGCMAFLRSVILKGQRQEGIEYRVKHRDGTWYWHSSSAVPLKDETGTIVGFYGIARDITEQKKAEEILRKSEENYRLIADNTTDTIWIFDMDFRLRYISPSIEKMRGFTVEEAMALPLDRHMTPDSLAAVRRLFEKEIEQEESGTKDPHRRVSFETEEYCRDGSTILVENSVALLRDAAGRPTGILGISRDITERKHVEEALRESEKKYRQLFEISSDALFVTENVTGKIIEVNEAATRMYGYSHDELLTLCNSDLSAEPEKTLGIMAIDSEDRVKVPVRYHRKKDGTVFPVEITVSFFTWNGRRVNIGSIRDISERKRADEDLQKAHDDLEIRVQERTAALRESEERLKLKLDSILMADTDISDLELINILDIPKIQSMMDDFSRLTCMVTAIVDLKGNVIESSGWQDICTKFHRINKQSAGFCIECDLYLARNLKPGQYVEYKCRNNLRDVVTPLFIGDKHVGNVYTGQFFYDDEIIEDTVFIAQAEEFGFDREKYMAALRAVPRFSHEQINRLMDYLVKLSGFISRLSYSNLKLAGAMTGQKQVQGELQTLYDELDKRVSERTAELSRAQAAYKQANKKLNLLSGITRHDINNQLLVARGFLKILHQKIPDPAYEKEFTRIEEAWSRIFGMIQFTKHYEQIGVSAPVWQNCRTLVDTAVKDILPGNVLVKNDLPENTEVFADPLIVKVFYNLVDNAHQYGVKISKIQFSLQESADGCCIICEDDGVGILPEDKERIFDRGFGKNTGMGLYLAREILSITNITITETGEPGKGARFEINVPKEAWRNSKGE